MKEKDLKINRNIHVIYSKACKKIIRENIAKHYKADEQENVWNRVQLQYVSFLNDWKRDLGGKENFHNRRGGTYDSIMLMCYYYICNSVVTVKEIEEMECDLCLPAFKKLRFVDCNKPIFKKLMHRAFMVSKKKCDRWRDYVMNVSPFEKDKPIYYEFTSCPIADFAKRYNLLEVMPAMCNPDYLAMKLIHAKLIRKNTCSNGDRCDYTIVGDRDKFIKGHEEYIDEIRYIRNK